MQARDVMRSQVVTVGPRTHVRDIAKLLLERRISAVPVVDDGGRPLGIVSEGDLMRRPESGTERHPSWWLRLFSSPDDKPIEYIKSHGAHAEDVMTRDLVSVSEEASLEEVANLLEKHHIKRVPVLRDSGLVGIVSRADLLRGLVTRQAGPMPSKDDRALKAEVEKALQEAGAGPEFLGVTVSAGTVHLWGAVNTAAEKQAARVAAENVAGVKAVRDEIGVLPPMVRSLMGAE